MYYILIQKQLLINNVLLLLIICNWLGSFLKNLEVHRIQNKKQDNPNMMFGSGLGKNILYIFSQPWFGLSIIYISISTIVMLSMSLEFLKGSQNEVKFRRSRRHPRRRLLSDSSHRTQHCSRRGKFICHFFHGGYDAKSYGLNLKEVSSEDGVYSS